MKTMRVAVTGPTGRMGTEVMRLIAASPDDFGLAAAISRVPGVHASYRLEQVRPENVDVVVDFSSSDFFDELIDWCKAKKIPLVSGTTGLVERHHQQMVEAGRQIPILWSPNMSLGIAAVSRMFSALRLVGDFDFHIEEIHHRLKKDAPSGTALHLQAQLKEAIGKKAEISSVRGGGVYGIHRTLALGADEVITIEHSALNRSVFARGALQSARWLVQQKPGRYSMEDVFKN